MLLEQFDQKLDEIDDEEDVGDEEEYDDDDGDAAADAAADVSSDITNQLVNQSLTQQQRDFANAMNANQGLASAFGTGMNTGFKGLGQQLAAGGAFQQDQQNLLWFGQYQQHYHLSDQKQRKLQNKKTYP